MIEMMSTQEIVFTYRQAPSKAKQVRVLADLNSTTPEEIIQVLKENGETVSARTLSALGLLPSAAPEPDAAPVSNLDTEPAGAVTINPREAEWFSSNLRRFYDLAAEGDIASTLATAREILAALDMIIFTRGA